MPRRLFRPPDPPLTGMAACYKLLMDPVVVVSVLLLMAGVLIVPVTTAEAEALSVLVIPVLLLRAPRSKQGGLFR